MAVTSTAMTGFDRESRSMAKLQLSFACGLYDRMQPLYTGEVKVKGIELNFIAIDQPRPIFDRMAAVRNSTSPNISSSEFVQRFANKQCPSSHPGIPFARLPPGFIAIHRQAGIPSPRTSKASASACRCDHDGGHLHQRAAGARIRRRSAQEYIGCRAP